MRAVYKLLDKDDKLLHIGETCNLRTRLRKHKTTKFPTADKIIELESGDWTRKESYHKQCEWQKLYGLKTDEEIRIESSKIITEKRHNHLKRISKLGSSVVIKKYGNDHFKRMSKLGSSKGAKTMLSLKVTCPICNQFTGAPPHVGNHKKHCKG